MPTLAKAAISKHIKKSKAQAIKGKGKGPVTKQFQAKGGEATASRMK